MAGRVSDVYSYEGALGSLDNYTYRKVVDLDVDGNVINYEQELEEAGKVLQLGEGWGSDAPYKWLIRDGIYSEATTGNNTHGVTDVLYGLCDVSINPISNTNAELVVSGKGVTFSDSTKNTAASIAKFPLNVTLTGVGRALGLDMTYSDADDILENWDHSEEWEKGIIPYLKYCFGTVIDNAYRFWMSKDIINKIKNYLIAQGAFHDLEGHTNTWTEQTVVPYSSLQTTARLAYELLLKACTEAGMDLTSVDGKRIYDLYQYVQSDFQYWQYYTDTKIGYVTLSFGRGGDFSWSTYAVYDFFGFDTDTVISGDLVYPPTSTQHIVSLSTNGKTYRRDGIGYSGLNWHNWYNATSNWNVVESLTVNVENGNNYGSITLSNIGVLGKRLPQQSGAILPTANDSVTTTYPNWSKGAQISTPGNGTIDDINTKTDVLPITIPLTDPAQEPISQDDEQDGDNTDDATKWFPFLIPIPLPTPNFDFDPDVDLDPDVDVPDVDIPDTTIPIIPFIPMFSGSGTGMVNIYNPTFNQVAELTQFLWTSNIFDNIKKLFQDPMQAIISLNVLYATPTIGEDTENIIIGAIDTGVEDVNVITSQYIDINCGNIKINNYYGNALDYINTVIDVYLPFIGFVSIDASTAMNKELNIRYRIDVLTGVCVAFLYLDEMLLYTFNGNCAVQLPLSAQNHSSFIASSAGLLGSVLMAGVTKNPSALIGATASIPGMLNKPIERGGSLTSNAGAMGIKKPYLIITRNKPYNPANYNKYHGYPANTTVKLVNCSGYTRVQDIHLSGIGATQNELSEIENLLKGGVIL